MLFDWFTLIAQLVNFLVLVWLLKRYLYKPILDAIDERENLISSQLNAAEATRTNALKELENYQQKNTDFDQQRHDLLIGAISEVNLERQKLLEQTRKEVEALRFHLQESLRTEQLNMGSEIIRRTRTEVFAIVRKTLADLAGVNLEDQMAGVFISRINGLKTDEKEFFYLALNHSEKEISIRSMFKLSMNQQDAIHTVLKNNLKISAGINFETLPDTVSGIELIANGFKVSWTIDDYLASLETHLAELLNQNTETTSENIT